jgi:hypothetical protein
MKNNRLLGFLGVLICISLACNASRQLVAGNDAQIITNISVNPHSGTGSFSAEVRGRAENGTHTLSCYVSTDDPGNDPVYTDSLSGQDDTYDAYPFIENFNFTYSVPGAHALVCKIDNSGENSWSDDFIVTVEATSTVETSGSNNPGISGSPLVINGTANITGTRCPTAAKQVTLAVYPNDTAELEVNYVEFSGADPSDPCARNVNELVVSWYSIGTADRNAGTATFTDCGTGWSGGGILAYGTGTLTGTLTCSGVQNGNSETDLITMP